MAKEGLLEQFCSVYKVPRESIRIIEGCRDDIFRFFEDKKELFLSYLLKLKRKKGLILYVFIGKIISCQRLSIKMEI